MLKSILYVLLMAVASIVFLIASLSLMNRAFGADKEPPPKWLKDGVITVKLKNGKAHHFDSNNWKVVKRVKRSKHKPQFKTVYRWRTRTKTIVKHNRISVLAGYGPIGIQVQGDANRFKVKKEFGPITGLRYTRNLNSTWSLGIELLTNHTTAMALGWGW